MDDKDNFLKSLKEKAVLLFVALVLTISLGTVLSFNRDTKYFLGSLVSYYGGTSTTSNQNESLAINKVAPSAISQSINQEEMINYLNEKLGELFKHQVSQPSVLPVDMPLEQTNSSLLSNVTPSDLSIIQPITDLQSVTSQTASTQVEADISSNHKAAIEAMQNLLITLKTLFGMNFK